MIVMKPFDIRIRYHLTMYYWTHSALKLTMGDAWMRLKTNMMFVEKRLQQDVASPQHSQVLN